MHKLLNSLKASVNVMDVVIDVALIVALIPVIKGFISTYQSNFSSTELLLLGLVTLFIVIALVASIAKQVKAK